MVGKILATLDAIGATENTVIAFASDHGEMLGERGMWFKKHFFELALRVPLFFNAPSIAPQRVREFASLVDLLPTLMGLAAGSPWTSETENLEGIDLTKYFGKADAPAEREIYAEYTAKPPRHRSSWCVRGATS